MSILRFRFNLKERKRTGNFNFAKRVAEPTGRKAHSTASSLKSAGRNWKRTRQISARVTLIRHRPRIISVDSDKIGSMSIKDDPNTPRQFPRPIRIFSFLLMQRAIAILIYRHKRGVNRAPWKRSLNRLRRPHRAYLIRIDNGRSGEVSEENSRGIRGPVRRRDANRRNLYDMDQTRTLNARIEIYLTVVQKDRPMETVKAGYTFCDIHRILLSRCYASPVRCENCTNAVLLHFSRFPPFAVARENFWKSESSEVGFHCVMDISYKKVR